MKKTISEPICVIYNGLSFNTEDKENFTFFEKTINAISKIKGEFIVFIHSKNESTNNKLYKNIGNSLKGIYDITKNNIVKLYVENGDFKMKSPKNKEDSYVIFRKWKNNINDEEKNTITSKWINESTNLEDLLEYTKKIGEDVIEKTLDNCI